MSPSQLAWLDYSVEDERRAREVIALFSQRESRDELGIGAIRDALADVLFPGTSVVLTRARYFLFVPWLFQEGNRRGHTGQRLIAWVEGNERRLIIALRQGGDLDGLIGRIAGTTVQNLPSRIYWNALGRLGILQHPGTMSAVAALPQRARGEVEGTERAERPREVWNGTMPDPVPEFFDFGTSTFSLSNDEASWLGERIGDSAPDTYFAFLAEHEIRPTADYAWLEAAAEQSPPSIKSSIDVARRFALLLHGAALLYNVLLAERADEFGMQQYENNRAAFVEELGDWEREVADSDLRSWNLLDLWSVIAQQGTVIAPFTRAFVEEWAQLVDRMRTGSFATYEPARLLVAERERYQKGSQARLSNERLMKQWGGASGSGRLNYRWPNVVRILTDIVDGRAS